MKNTISWLKLNKDELKKLLDDNYRDDKCEYVYSEIDAFNRRLVPGMTYLSYDYLDDFTYLVGLINDSNRNIIVGLSAFLENHNIFSDEKRPITYISFMEINKNYRNNGFFKIMCENLFKVISNENPIITSNESELGSNIEIVKYIEKVGRENGFLEEVLINNEENMERIYSLLTMDKLERG